MHRATNPVLLKWCFEVMCCDRSLEQVRGVEVLPSLFRTLSVTVHLSNPCPFSLSRPSSFISLAGTCPYQLWTMQYLEFPMLTLVLPNLISLKDVSCELTVQHWGRSLFLCCSQVVQCFPGRIWLHVLLSCPCCVTKNTCTSPSGASIFSLKTKMHVYKISQDVCLHIDRYASLYTHNRWSSEIQGTALSKCPQVLCGVGTLLLGVQWESAANGVSRSVSFAGNQKSHTLCMLSSGLPWDMTPRPLIPSSPQI